MMKLDELYKGIGTDIVIKSIQINSKEVSDGDLFVCTMGATADRHDFIDDAVKNGAKAIVVSKDIRRDDVAIIKVPDTNRELPYLCQKFYDFPDKKLKMLGVTGTDGKTSTATIIQTLIGSDVCGYIGTNGRICAGFTEDCPNTTPDAHKLYAYLNEFKDFGCKYVAMEVSSEAVFRGRIQATEYDMSIYTNLTSEHMNIHGSMDNYKECKLQLFRQTKKDGYCIINNDDPYCEDFKKASNGQVLTYGKGIDNDLQIKDFKVYPNKTLITYIYKNQEIQIDSPLLGDFNVYNLAAGLLAVLTLGIHIEDIYERIPKIKVSGRLEMLNTDAPYYVMVDYAHTPNGIKNLLDFVHTLDINRSIVVIGSAGERDPYKRPVMGKTVCDNASYAIFTYEDPRSEEPIDIINMLVSDIKETHNNYEIVIDRREAIKKAISMAKEKDMVLILGKGNETYEKLKDKTIYFNDIEEAYQAVVDRKVTETN